MPMTLLCYGLLLDFGLPCLFGFVQPSLIFGHPCLFGLVRLFASLSFFASSRCLFLDFAHQLDIVMVNRKEPLLGTSTVAIAPRSVFL